MTTLTWTAVFALLSVLWAAPAAPPASFGPDEQYNGPTLNNAYIHEQGPSLNGSPLQPLDPTIRGFAVEAVELPDGTGLGRLSAPSPSFR